MRVLIFGGRDFTDRESFFWELTHCGEDWREWEVIAGKAPGADTLAEDFARTYGLKFLGFAADWKKHGKAAGPIRNQQMIDEAKPQLAIGFPGGRGTADMASRCKRHGIRLLRVGS